MSRLFGRVGAETLGGALPQLIYLYVIEPLSRASVPLLGLVSGFLRAPALARKNGWVGALRRRLVTLVVPLVLWNASAWSTAQSGPVSLPDHWLGWSNALVGVTHEPALFPLHFPRDLMVCGAHRIRR